MRKQLIRAILLAGLLCAPAFAQRVQTFGEAQFVQLQSSYTVGLNATEPRADEGRANSCFSARSTLLEIVAWDRDGQRSHKVPVWQVPGGQAFFFVSGMTIDVDGAPDAYNPDDTGLGILADQQGTPLIQQEGDPFPGYYISCTSLSDKTKNFTDPAAYVDATRIPYVVLPDDVADRAGARLGDFAVVMNLRNGKSSFAIYADSGTLGEGSIALADALGIWSDARHGGASHRVLYLLFPGSGNLQPRTIDEIKGEGEKLVSHWGGMNELSSCAESKDPTSAAKSF